MCARVKFIVFFGSRCILAIYADFGEDIPAEKMSTPQLPNTSTSGRTGVRAALRAQVQAHQANAVLGQSSQTKALGDLVAGGQSDPMYGTALALESRAARLNVTSSYNVVVVGCSPPDYIYPTIMALVLLAAVMPLANYPHEPSPVSLYLSMLNISSFQMGASCCRA